MDYIQEELLRQRAAWAAMLLGSGAERETAETAASQGETAWDGEARDAAAQAAAFAAWGRRDEKRGMEPVRRGARTPAMRSAERAAAMAESLPETQLLRQPGAEDGAASGRNGSLSAELAPMAGLLRAKARAENSWSGAEHRPPAAAGGSAERSVTEVFWAEADRGGEPRALSRAFQRDARRYDGGFSLY